MKKDFKHIEEHFRRKFEELLKKERLENTNVYERPYRSPLDDEFLTAWQSEDLMKVMRLQEAKEDDTLQFGYAVGKSGLNYEYDDMLIVAINSNEKAELIFDLYKMWFFENKSPTEMERVLETYFKKFNRVKMKGDNNYIREDFKRRFEALAQKDNVVISNMCPWPYPLSLDDTFMVRWQSEDAMKMMRLKEAEEGETMQFDYTIGNSGLGAMYDYLSIETINTNEKAEVIFEIYKLWFIENRSPAEIQETLSAYFKDLNSQPM